MGCYGFGVSRAVAAAIEANHDDMGIVWPASITPFHAIVLPVNVGRRHDDGGRGESSTPSSTNAGGTSFSTTGISGRGSSSRTRISSESRSASRWANETSRKARSRFTTARTDVRSSWTFADVAPLLERFYASVR